MATFTNREYADIHFIYGYCNGNARAAVEEYRTRFPARRVPHRQVFYNVHRTLQETGRFPTSISERPVRQQTGNEEAILDIVENSPHISVRRISNRTGVSRMQAWRALRTSGLYPYHIASVQALQPADHAARAEFCSWLVQHQDLPASILFTDEATFNRDGMPNTRNSHIWARDNPHATNETHHQQRFSLNVWCGVLDDQLIGPFVMQRRVTSEHYLHFLKNELVGLLEEVSLQKRKEMWIQHDGAPLHFGKQVTAFLNDTYPNRWIGRGGPIAWPPRSPDLNPLDYYLWGHMKSMVYATKIHTEDELLTRILDTAASLRADNRTLQRATSSIVTRAEMCLERRGGHFEQLL